MSAQTHPSTTTQLSKHHTSLTMRIHLAGRQLKGERGYKPLRAPRLTT